MSVAHTTAVYLVPLQYLLEILRYLNNFIGSAIFILILCGGGPLKVKKLRTFACKVLAALSFSTTDSILKSETKSPGICVITELFLVMTIQNESIGFPSCVYKVNVGKIVVEEHALWNLRKSSLHEINFSPSNSAQFMISLNALSNA